LGPENSVFSPRIPKGYNICFNTVPAGLNFGVISASIGAISFQFYAIWTAQTSFRCTEPLTKRRIGINIWQSGLPWSFSGEFIW
jgi:hypothetical protein